MAGYTSPQYETSLFFNTDFARFLTLKQGLKAEDKNRETIAITGFFRVVVNIPQGHTFATNALEHGMDVKTLSTIIGHVSSATTLNIYAHVTDDMQKRAAEKIDRGIGKAVTPAEERQIREGRTMTAFEPQRGKHRYHGSGFLRQLKGGRWAGRYTINMAGWKKRDSKHLR